MGLGVRKGLGLDKVWGETRCGDKHGLGSNSDWGQTGLGAV